MRILLYCTLLLLTLSCEKPESDSVAPEYMDWYTIKSPIDDVIQAVWGDRDRTLLIATPYTIFRSTDQGKSWQQVDQHQSGISGIVDHKDTLFVMNGVINTQNTQIMANVSKYSIDDGKNWQPYRKYNSFFNRPVLGPIDQKLYINPTTALNGTVYRINKVYVDSQTSASRLIETPGVITNDERRIDLPQLHQLESLYLDTKGRLYIAGTDAICGRGDQNQGYLYCNSKKGRGVVYISKRPLP